ncbi:MAG: hypothetical protein WD749_12910 [Phycisphaerales bacterium]
MARRLFALEAAAPGRPRAGAASLDGDPASAARVCEKLGIVLTAFAGTAGFRALLSRALALAKAKEPALAPVTILEDGSLGGLDNLPGPGRGEEAQVLVAQLLDLLAVFIGEPLTLRLVRDAWPDVPAKPGRSRNEGTP